METEKIQRLKSNSHANGSEFLTAGRNHELDRQTMRIPRSYEKWWVDWNLLDAYKIVFANYPKLTATVTDAAKDKRLTKWFYHHDAMLQNVLGFMGKEQPDASYLMNLRVARRVLARTFPKPGSLKPNYLSKNSDPKEFWTNEDGSAGAIADGTKLQNAEVCLETALQIKEAIEGGKSFSEIWIPAKAFHRGQLKGISDGVSYTPEDIEYKDRLVWGLDGATILVEAQYAPSLIEWLKQSAMWYAGGKEPGELRRLVKYYNRACNYWTSIDYSKFDQTIPSWLINVAFDMVKRCFPRDCHNELDWICYNFIHTHILVGGVGDVQKHRGIPSGSNFTQLIGSIVNALMMLTYVASLKKNASFEEKLNYVDWYLDGFIVMGDDNIVFSENKIDMTHMSSYVHHVFGVKIHDDEKADAGSFRDYPKFLKREWREDGEYQDPVYMLINSTHPENDNRDKGYDEGRYTAWHIMYGMFVTYRATFPDFVQGVRCELFLVNQMKRSGGIESLLKVPLKSLPGVFKAYGRQSRYLLYKRAERVAKAASM